MAKAINLTNLACLWISAKYYIACEFCNYFARFFRNYLACLETTNFQ